MRQVLNDPQQPPTDEVLQSVMGENYPRFHAFCALLERFGISCEWNYYKDGKSWLCKAQCRKKTVVWISVWEECFKCSFFFTEKNRDGIGRLGIDPRIQSEFSAQKAAGKLIPLILEVRDDAILTDLEKIINYKIA